ncbi:hypothetical protein LFL97_07155 [Burkholderia sp. JSH-S8]|nr:hypothetical protein [Burkholderia stagnalis]WGS43297.1 hypothetical protein LFL97_07155 [Burkholderia sp. JSH-S8]
MKGIRRVHWFERRCVCKVYRVQTGLQRVWNVAEMNGLPIFVN